MTGIPEPVGTTVIEMIIENRSTIMKIPWRQIPGSSKFLLDYFEHPDKVDGFLNSGYRDLQNFYSQSDEVKKRTLALDDLVAVLTEQNRAFGCGQPTLAKLALLQSGACAVVTGQQTGLFGGPLLTVYKVLTAIKIAERLNRSCDGCFVPVFWLASDDHDFLEVNHVNILNKSNEISKIAYGEPSDGKRIPVAAIHLTSEIEKCIAMLDELTHPSEFKQDIIHGLSAAYASGNTLSHAFGRWMTTLFQSFGLILIDAADARLKKMGSSVFRQEISDFSPSTGAAMDMSKRLLDHGYHNQVQIHEGLLNLFYIDEERKSVQIEQGEYNIKTSGTFSRDSLLELLDEKPQRFSPNVLLRPLYQDALLPTVSYVAGPAEIAYYAQMKGIYERFGLPMPVIYPRKSLSLMEARIVKVLDSYALQVSDFWDEVEALMTRVAGRCDIRLLVLMQTLRHSNRP
jgi:bacillithiol biosynthesis cysteine-adding enzyme BshC